MNVNLLILVAAILSVPMQALGYYFIWGRKIPETMEFTYSRYITTFIAPLAVLLLAVLIDLRYLLFYIIFSGIGFMAELSYGFIFHRTFGKRLWTYQHKHLGRYTCYLTLPLWGFGGLVVWACVKVLKNFVY